MSGKFSLGLVGHPVATSLSPPMHEAALKHCGLSGSYKLIDILPADLFTAVKRLKQQGLAGFNVTIPHKTTVLHNCNERSREVSRVGAANTIKIMEDGSMSADNTDIYGFANALDQVYNKDIRPYDEQKTACILGAGGASKAAIDVLTSRCFDKIYILARDAAKARQLASHWSNDFNCRAQLIPVGFSDTDTISGAELFISTIPYGQTVPMEKNFLSHLFSHRGNTRPFIFDMVYSRNGAETALEHLARELNIDACDGTNMLIHQAIKSFQIWTNQHVPFNVMHEALVTARSQRTI
jgi:shikimate dehydrogenase